MNGKGKEDISGGLVVVRREAPQNLDPALPDTTNFVCVELERDEVVP